MLELFSCLLALPLAMWFRWSGTLFATHSGNLEHKNRDISNRRAKEKQCQGKAPVISGEDNFRAAKRESQNICEKKRNERNEDFYAKKYRVRLLVILDREILYLLN